MSDGRELVLLDRIMCSIAYCSTIKKHHHTACRDDTGPDRSNENHRRAYGPSVESSVVVALQMAVRRSSTDVQQQSADDRSWPICDDEPTRDYVARGTERSASLSHVYPRWLSSRCKSRLGCDWRPSRPYQGAAAAKCDVFNRGACMRCPLMGGFVLFVRSRSRRGTVHRVVTRAGEVNSAGN